jgi:copper homeostasis protein
MAGVVLEVAVSDPRDVSEQSRAAPIACVVPGPTCRCLEPAAVTPSVARATPAFVLLRLTTRGRPRAGSSRDSSGWAGLLPVARPVSRSGSSMPTWNRHRDLPDLLDRLPNVPWTFHRAIDSSHKARAAPAEAARASVPGRGPVSGLGARGDGLRRPDGHLTPENSGLVMPGGGLAAEHVPWLTQGGCPPAPPGTQVRRRIREGVRRRGLRRSRSMVDDLLDDSDR